MTGDSPSVPEIVKQLETLSTSAPTDAGWSDEALLAIIRDDSFRLLARLHACEILLRRNRQKFLGVIGTQAAAAIYASALRERVTDDMNPWAFLGLGELGTLGRHVVECGDSALAEFVPLLEDRQTAGIYSGSEESKEGNGDRARVCDFAAFFISRIMRVPYSFRRDSMEQRDADIDRLKERLKVSP